MSLFNIEKFTFFREGEPYMCFFIPNREAKDEPRTSKPIVQGNLIYMPNEEIKRASVIGHHLNGNEVFIPRSFKNSKFTLFFGKEYLVTTIGKKSFELSSIKHIRFPKDSVVNTIEKSAFSDSDIKSIYLPKSITYLQDGWCKSTKYLINVEIDPENDFYAMENGLLIGTREFSLSHETKHKLFFANRNITKAVIPSSIEHICPYAFENCQQLETVEFGPISNVLSIGKSAFRNCSSLKKFILPHRIEKIEKFTFCGSFDYFESFEFESDPRLKIIGEGAFKTARIGNFTLPRSVTRIDKLAFSGCPFLSRFYIDAYCMLETIGAESFCDTGIECLSLPHNFQRLEDYWCKFTPNLQRLHVNENYSECNDLIVGKSDQKSDCFDTLVFAPRNISNVVIPPFVEFISPFAFQFCENIVSFEIQPNSQLKIIGQSAFANSTITNFVLPNSATKICEDAFDSCEKLRFFELENNSMLQVIEEGSFRYSSIIWFTFPSSLTEIGQHVFHYCEDLEIVEFDENINMESLHLSDLFNIEKTVIMVPTTLKNIIH